MAFIRKTRKKDGTYLELVESYREKDKVKQRFIRYLGKEIDGRPAKRILSSNIGVESVKRYGDVLCVDKLARDLSMHDMVDKNVLLLAYSHLLEELSISRVGAWARTTRIPDVLEMEHISTGALYDSLTSLDDKDFASVESAVYDVFSGLEDENEALVVDITDTYFEGEKAGAAKKRRGKDGKYAKHIQIALALTLKNGFPVMHRTYSGNISDMRIFSEMSAMLRERDFDSIIMDRGAHSKDNINRIGELGMRAVIGLRKTPELKKLISSVPREELYSRKHWVKLKNTDVYVAELPYMDGKAVIVYDPVKEALRRPDIYARGRGEESVRYVGYSLIYHNTGLSAEDVVKQYFGKDIVERSFKQMKGAISLRPVRVWREHQINGHVRVCYLAYAILSLLSYKLKGLEVSPTDALKKLSRAYLVELKDSESGFAWSSSVRLEKLCDKIFDRVGVKY